MSSSSQSEGHVLMPTVAIGSLALVLSAGFGFLGIMDRANAMMARALESGGLGQPTKALPDWIIWAASMLGAFGLSLAILCVTGKWRRTVLWISALVVVAGWGPVLMLASRAPEIAIPMLAVFWSGLCAFIYAGKHHMAADG